MGNPVMSHDGMLIDGWVTLTNTGKENVIYGPFKTEEEAERWVKNLILGSQVKPIYSPQFNRG